MGLQASVKEVRDNEEPVVVYDTDKTRYQIEYKFIGNEPKDSD
jgi:hypothetical protein